MPAEWQPVENKYIRCEFKRHKDCNDAEASAFLAKFEKHAVFTSRSLGVVFPDAPAEAPDSQVYVDDKDSQLSLYEINCKIMKLRDEMIKKKK